MPDFSYVYAQWRDATHFKSIAEYFSADESTGGHLVLRSNPAVRRGMYFRIGVPWNTRVPDNSIVTLEYIRSDSPNVLTQSYTLPKYPANPLLEAKLGLTGKDWPEKKITPVAWRITLRDPDGAIIARRQSFLWGIPREKIVEK